jgi:uncharacterized membrane protein YphA (DoxX/SURF4 family)
MKGFTVTEKIFQVLRLGVAMCFIGHGTFGILTKEIWCNYFAVFGIGHDTAYRLMPIVGTADVLLGISMLVYPTRAVTAWLVVWGLVTAALRPLSGEPFAEFIERAGNYGVPMSLIFFSGGFSQAIFAPLKRIRTAALDGDTLRWVFTSLRLTTFLLLAGHGWLNLIEKPGLISQYQALGFSQPVAMAHLFGAFELLSALAIVLFPNRPLLLVLLVWKISCELIYPQYELFEWIERGGSYAAILALWFCLELRPLGESQEISDDQIPGTPART